MTNRESALETALQIVLAYGGNKGIWITTCDCRPNAWMPTWYEPRKTRCPKCRKITDSEWIDAGVDTDTAVTCKVMEPRDGEAG